MTFSSKLKVISVTEDKQFKKVKSSTFKFYVDRLELPKKIDTGNEQVSV